MKARWVVVGAALSVIAACAERAEKPAAEQKAAPGRRDTVVGAAAPICASAAQAYVASRAATWWRQKVDPTGRGDGPYAYGGENVANPPIIEAIAALRTQSVQLNPEAKAHRWERRGDGVRLTVEGELAGEPGYLATFDLVADKDSLAIRSFSVLRGSTRYVCDGERLAASGVTAAASTK